MPTHYLKTKDGTWLKPSIETNGAAPESVAKWALAVAVDLKLGALEVVDADTDPRSGVQIEDPTVVANPPAREAHLTDAELRAVRALLAKS